LPLILSEAIAHVKDVESAKRHCDPFWGVSIFNDIQDQHQAAEVWMQFLVHLSTFVGGEDIVKCFENENCGSMVTCIILTAYHHPETEPMVFQFFKNVLCDRRGQILEQDEIRTVAKEISRNMRRKFSSRCFHDLQPGRLQALLLCFGKLSISPIFRGHMRRSPEYTISSLKSELRSGNLAFYRHYEDRTDT
jgi:hypothetical protein